MVLPPPRTPQALPIRVLRWLSLLVMLTCRVSRINLRLRWPPLSRIRVLLSPVTRCLCRYRRTLGTRVWIPVILVAMFLRCRLTNIPSVRFLALCVTTKLLRALLNVVRTLVVTVLRLRLRVVTMFG